ncbi:hypothetical protein [Paenibacillus herberti]|uniref:Uncharacterized protein n=1 Tax=Paenibacillus herberti TaxID=1619309 RepID=A0A229NSV1_9BACL|nr:hypothetical protein [Paenibacillus herberti]OXM12978.1 hypothetical protein CGZ75_24240 [Paenibacillus herberti]
MDHFQPASISNVKGSSLGVILVLFILLVIVTRVFFPVSPYCVNGNSNVNSNDPIYGTKGFDLWNEIGDGYTLVFRKTYGLTSPPDSLTISYNNRAHFEVDNLAFRVSTGGALYDINFQGNKIGSLEFTMVNRVGRLYEPNEINNVILTPTPHFIYTRREPLYYGDPWLRIRLGLQPFPRP